MGAAALTLAGLVKPVRNWMIITGASISCAQYLILSWSAIFDGGAPRCIAIDGQACDPFQLVRNTAPIAPGARFEFLYDLPAGDAPDLALGLWAGQDKPRLPVFALKAAGEKAKARPAFKTLPPNPRLPPEIRLGEARKLDFALEPPKAAGGSWTFNGQPQSYAGKPLFTVKRGTPVSAGFANKSDAAVSMRGINQVESVNASVDSTSPVPGNSIRVLVSRRKDGQNQVSSPHSGAPPVAVTVANVACGAELFSVAPCCSSNFRRTCRPEGSTGWGAGPAMGRERAGLGELLGPYLLGGYRWFLNDQLDGTFHLDYRLERGVGDTLFFEARHVGEESHNVRRRQAGMHLIDRGGDAQCADRRGLVPQRAPELAGQLHGRGLAVGPRHGDADIGERREEARRHAGKESARVGVRDMHRTLDLRLRPRHDRNRARCYCLWNEILAIHPPTLECAEHASGRNLSVIDRKAGDSHIGQIPRQSFGEHIKAH